jgi:bleomycin hydrolase
MKKLTTILTLLGFLFSASAFAQEDEKSEVPEGYIFTNTIELDASPVENQYRSSTCWSFSALSFFESELMRMGKGDYDLSEMFIVHHNYADKAKKYVRMHGSLELAGGGAFHDVTDIFKEYGIVPDQIYSGKNIGEENHIHSEMDNVIKAYVDAVVENKNRKLSPAWFEGLEGILNAYLGEIPEEFEYEGKTYTPKSFAASLGLNMDDYVELSSFMHHPFYEAFILEVPDNWRWGTIYNLPVDEMGAVIDYALNKGYTVAWGTDMSEKGFSWKNGLAIVPDYNVVDLSGTEKEKWEKLTKAEKEASLYKFDVPGVEKEITQEMRQKVFDNYSMTDDHGMHITGMAEDQKGNKYYIVKNSWGEGGKYDGYLYASEPFVLLNTIDIMVHKDALPDKIRRKLNL